MKGLKKLAVFPEKHRCPNSLHPCNRPPGNTRHLTDTQNLDKSDPVMYADRWRDWGEAPDS